ncbi:MAG: hypothetical protein DLM62_18080 [Pseudonocardiales bacterium]|nr:MAG: hypothetical protein DLM62_18080 [Pseudonocardiales bacterium]
MAIEPHRSALPGSGPDEDAIPWEQIATRVANKHGVTLAAIGLIIAQLAWKAAVLSHFFFWQDDFVYFDRALDNGLTWQYLMKVEGGHLDPGPFAVSWFMARISLYNWTLVSVVLLVILAGACLALLRLLRTLFGNRPAILIPLVVYLLSPLTVPALVWWSSAIESLPLQLATFMAIDAHVRYLRGRHPKHLIIASAWLLAGMLFFEKGIVLPLLLFALTSAFFVEGRWIRAARLAAIRYWKAWLLYAVVLAGYASVLVIQLSAPGATPGKRGSPQHVTGFITGLIKNTFVPGALGGPWQWFPNPTKVEAFATPPTVLTWLSLFGAAAVVLVSIWHRIYAWRAWAILAAWLVLADMLPVILGRATLSNGAFLAFLSLDTHYVADAVPILAICLGLAFWPIAGQPDRRRMPQARAVTGQVVPVATGVTLGVFLFGSVWSVQAYVTGTTTQPGRAFIANARQALAAVPRGTVVVNQLASSDLMAAILLGPYGYDDQVIGKMAPGRVRWTRQPVGTIADLKVLGPDGRLWPAAAVGITSKPVPARGSCWPAKGESIPVMLRAYASVANGGWTLRMSYASSEAQQVNVYFGGRSVPLALKQGLNTAYLTVQGSGNEVIVAAPGGIGKLCLGNIEVGVLLQNLSGPPIPAVTAPG